MTGQTAAEEAGEREATAHGCCCSCCKLIWELKFALGLDVFIFVFALAGINPSYPEAFQNWMKFYLYFVVLPSACLFLYAILNGNKSGAPRLLLVRFLVFWKIPAFFLLYSLFFTISPWAQEVNEFMCDPKNDFEHGKVSRMFPDYESCVTGVPKVMVPAMIPRLLIYLYSIKGAWEYMRCHPENDGKGLCSSTSQAKERGDYEPLLAA